MRNYFKHIGQSMGKWGVTSFLIVIIGVLGLSIRNIIEFDSYVGLIIWAVFLVLFLVTYYFDWKKKDKYYD